MGRGGEASFRHGARVLLDFNEFSFYSFNDRII